MEMLYVIDDQISTLQSSIYSTNQQLIQKRDDLERLKTLFGQLEDYQEEFKVNQKYCCDPELTVHTWNGQLATQFHLFRIEEIQTSYQSISEYQLDGMIMQIADKIAEIKATIGDLQSDYAAKNANLSDLKAQRREEMVK
ncbi:DUF5082 domain-containing protein [Virgibacillus dakarensis]|nr:DUF5082 domain-containing protein [Virgibacillus dakarensis]